MSSDDGVDDIMQDDLDLVTCDVPEPEEGIDLFNTPERQSYSFNPQQQSSKRKSSADSCLGASGKRPARPSSSDMDCGNEDLVMFERKAEHTPYIDPWIEHYQNMTPCCQMDALAQLMDACGISQIRAVRQLIEPHFQKDFLSFLPAEIALHIVSLLPLPDVVRAAGVCRSWKILCEDDRAWKLKCENDGIQKLPDPSDRCHGAWAGSADGNGVTIHNHLPHSEVTSRRWKRIMSEVGSMYLRTPHKSLYLRRCRITANWRSLPIGGSCILKGHEEHVITCLQIHNDMIVTGSDDNTLKVWSIDRGELRFTLTGHTGGVWTSQLSTDGRFIVSGSTDRTVKVWCAQKGNLIHTLIGHTSTVRCMSLNKNILVSGSRDASCRVWNIETGRCTMLLLGHVAAVRCVQFDGKRVVSGAYDFNIKVWNHLTGECIFTLVGHTNRVYSLLLDSERDLVVSGSLDTTIRVWDIKKGAAIAQLVGHQSLTSGMQLRGDILVSCNADSDVRVWNIRDGSCLHRLHGENGHRSAITSLQYLSNDIVATSSDDGTVKLWDVAKGVFIRDVVSLESGGSGGCIWRLKATDTLLACAVGSRNGTEDTKLILIDFDAVYP